MIKVKFKDSTLECVGVNDRASAFLNMYNIEIEIVAAEERVMFTTPKNKIVFVEMLDKTSEEVMDEGMEKLIGIGVGRAAQ